MKKSTDNKCWSGCWENGILLHCCWESNVEQPLWKPIQSFRRKLDRTIIWSRNLTPGHTPRPNYSSKGYMHSYVHSSTIHNSQDMGTTEVSTSRWMDKDVVHVYKGIVLSHKKEYNITICSNMDAARDYPAKRSKSEKERQIPYDTTYMWNPKYGTSELVYKIETNSQTWRTDSWSQRGRLGREKNALGFWGW